MIDQQSIERAAWNMLKAHGDEAVEIAQQTAQQLLAKGDEQGRQLWVAVVEALDTLRH